MFLWDGGAPARSARVQILTRSWPGWRGQIVGPHNVTGPNWDMHLEPQLGKRHHSPPLEGLIEMHVQALPAGDDEG